MMSKPVKLTLLAVGVIAALGLVVNTYSSIRGGGSSESLDMIEDAQREFDEAIKNLPENQ